MGGRSCHSTELGEIYRMVVSDGCSKFLFFDFDMVTLQKASQNSFFIDFYRVPALFGSIFATGTTFRTKMVEPNGFSSPEPRIVCSHAHASKDSRKWRRRFAAIFLQKKEPLSSTAASRSPSACLLVKLID